MEPMRDVKQKASELLVQLNQYKGNCPVLNRQTRMGARKIPVHVLCLSEEVSEEGEKMVKPVLI